MKNKKMNAALALVWILVVGLNANAQILGGGDGFPTPVGGADPHSTCVIPKIDGERVPFPLKNANSKFELAENETYILNGTVIQQDGKSFFKVDFNSQPWLATQKRVQFPLFLIDSSDTVVMKKFNGALVQMAVVVRKQDVSTAGQEWDSSVKLDVIANPIRIK